MTERSRDLALGVLLLEIFALVVLLLAANQGKLGLDPATKEIEIERHQSQALPFDGADKASDFATMHEKLSRPRRLMIEHVALSIGSDEKIEEEDLAVLYDPEGVSQVGFALAERLDLRAGKYDSGFPGIQYFVVVTGALVPCDRFWFVIAFVLFHATIKLDRV